MAYPDKYYLQQVAGSHLDSTSHGSAGQTGADFDNGSPEPKDPDVDTTADAQRAVWQEAQQDPQSANTQPHPAVHPEALVHTNGPAYCSQTGFGSPGEFRFDQPYPMFAFQERDVYQNQPDCPSYLDQELLRIPSISIEQSDNDFSDLGDRNDDAQRIAATAETVFTGDGSMPANQPPMNHMHGLPLHYDPQMGWLSRVAMEIDHVDNYNGNLASRVQPQSWEDPWTPERMGGQRSNVNYLTTGMSTSEASRTSNADGNISDPVSPYASFTDSTGGNDIGGTTGWGEGSTATIFPGHHASHTEYPTNDDYHGHVLGHPATAEYPISTQHTPRAQPALRRRARRNSSFLSAPQSQAQGSRCSSPASSAGSGVICCDICGAEFRGAYGKGNLGRHYRHKHNGNARTYECQHNNCGRVFARSDARLKHYRKYHPHLASGPAVPRTTRSAKMKSMLRISTTAI